MGPAVVLDAEPTHPNDLLGMITEELMGAMTNRDRAEMMHALRAFMMVMKQEDQE